MNIVLNEDEQAALLLCSLEARSVYVFGLRPLMDVRTGLVGVASAISYGGLALCVQYAPPKGSRRPAWLATRPQSINLVDELEREGLAKRYSRKSQEDKQLVILLAKADRILARPKSEGHMRVTPGEVEQSGAGAGFAGYEGHSSKSDEGHISEDRIKPSVLDTSPHIPPSVVAREEVPNRTVQVVMQLIEWERQRGKQLRLNAADPRVVEWVTMDLTDLQLRAVYDQAVVLRVNAGDASPVNAGLLNSMVGRLMRGEGQNRSAEGAKVVPFRRGSKPNPRAALEKWVLEQNGGVGDDDEQRGCIEGECESVVEADA